MSANPNLVTSGMGAVMDHNGNPTTVGLLKGLSNGFLHICVCIHGSVLQVRYGQRGFLWQWSVVTGQPCN